MTNLTDVVEYLDHLLDTHSIPQDKSKNGLQVEGCASISKVIGGVDACLDLYEMASANSAEFIIVHHGEIWGDGIQSITGHLLKRYEILLRKSISLYAVHLPLDIHPQFGHNAKIAEFLGLKNVHRFASYAGIKVGVYGELPTSITVPELASRIDEILHTTSVSLDFSTSDVSRIGIVSGAGASALYECKKRGIGCLVTGEIDHASYHPSKELGISLIAAGHYKTEVPGIIAVLKELENHFGLECQFLDIPTGI